MKNYKLSLIFLLVINLYLFSCLLKKYGVFETRFLNDYIWIYLSPILFLILILYFIFYLIYTNTKIFDKLNFKNRIPPVINFILSSVLTYYSIKHLDAITDGGLFRHCWS